MSNPNRPGIKKLWIQKNKFSLLFLCMDTSVTIHVIELRFSLCLLEAFPEGRVSFEIGSSFHSKTKNGNIFVIFTKGKFLNVCLIFPCRVWHIYYSKNRISNVCECIRGYRRPLMKTCILFLRAHICRRTYIMSPFIAQGEDGYPETGCMAPHKWLSALHLCAPFHDMGSQNKKWISV